MKISLHIYILLFLLFIGVICQPLFGNLFNHRNNNVFSSPLDDTITINVGLLDAVFPSFTSPNEMGKILHGYSWKKDNVCYEFRVHWFTDVQILGGALKKDFDVLIIPGIGKEFRWLGASSFGREIRDFVSNGGGYLGTCGGANLASEGLVKPCDRGWVSWTVWEWFMNISALGLAPVEAYQDMADPVASTLLWKQPARVGQSAFLWYNLTIDGTGVCQYYRVNRTHPIFTCSETDLQLMRWVGGPALLPKNSAVSVLAWYPYENISGEYGNQSTSIHAWRYDYLNPLEPCDLWDMDSLYIETHLAGKPVAIACNYGKGRVVLFGNHPEHPVWKGGFIVENDTLNDIMLFKGLFQWAERNPLQDEYTWWIIRRSVAWVAKIPDQHLPPCE